jgi:hypothetical protein
MKKQKKSNHETISRRNKIALPFEKAIEGLLSVKPKKKPTKKKKKPSE